MTVPQQPAPAPQQAPRTGGVDISGPCDEAEHANDPRCTGVGGGRVDDHGGGGDNSGPGNSHDDFDDDSSGSGHSGGDDDFDDDSSGSGSGGDDFDDDSSGHGGGDNSGHGGGDDD